MGDEEAEVPASLEEEASAFDPERGLLSGSEC
jgi:hypothetical protein